ncbi:MAG: hypothetical protein IPN17_38295 [Deltaproteobacteria bacterium]|nr:hypothetical protein [Deltaproteobacteria bacterium]
MAAGRVTRLPDGNVAYRVKSPRSVGATHRVMSPMGIVSEAERSRASAGSPLVRYHGVFAPHSPWRSAVVPLPTVGPQCPRGFARAREGTGGSSGAKGPLKPRRR